MSDLVYNKETTRKIKVRNDIEISIDYCDSYSNPLTESGELKIRFVHKRYNFPDNYKDNNDFSECKNFKDEVKQVIEDNEQAFYVSMYEHGDCNFSLVDPSFKGGWDSGLLGFIIAPLDMKEKYIRSLLEDFTNRANGNVYGYRVDKIISCKCCNQETEREEIGACSGFYGFEHSTNGMYEHILGDLSDLNMTGEEEEKLKKELDN